mmetsp:Transcript_15945/g.32298  ORF Transcript_15945/g.32298 Transcript_15945/m.32298 type:complete len:126 (+) Transcript_15945:2-379(+)
MCMDIHGDENLPYNFILGAEAIPAWNASPRLKSLQDAFCTAFMKASPDFQCTVGYSEQPPPELILCVGAKQIANRFDCLAFTVEMPYKDTVEDPLPGVGWSAQRSGNLGRSVLDAVLTILPNLRA